MDKLVSEFYENKLPDTFKQTTEHQEISKRMLKEAAEFFTSELKKEMYKERYKK